MRAILTGLCALVFSAPPAFAESVQAGLYLCTVEQTAQIGSSHVEGAGPPTVSVNATPYQFRLRASTEADGRLRIVEAPFDGESRSRFQWEDENSTLHAPYVGDGFLFGASGAPGFLRFSGDRWGNALQFYHSGFQYGGGEDESLAVRWGRCEPE